MTRLQPTSPLIQVAADASGTPIGLSLAGQAHDQVGVCNRWRVDDGWWREPVARTYWKLVTRDGLLCVVFLDELRGTWHLERVFD